MNAIEKFAAGGMPARSTVFELVQSSRLIRRIARVVLAGLLFSVAAMFFLPWQQTSRGSGRVIAFVPQERQQTVTSPIKGIVESVTPGMVEGARVSQGVIVLELQPQAANLREQLENQLDDLRAKFDAAGVKSEAYRRNISGFEQARDFAVLAADEMIASAKAKLDAKKRLVSGYQAKQLQASQNFERQTRLVREGATAERELEQLKRDLDVANAELESALLEVTAAEQEYEAKKHERDEKRSAAETKVDESRAYEQAALGEQSSIQKDIRDLEIRVEELSRQTITAPRDGTIFRIPLFERGQAIQEGDPLFTIVPDTSQRAVELWISGNDVPLVRPGDHVRLQFEGWPAVQVTGWPSVAVGTFGGEVFAVDATDDGLGRFRIQVQPCTDPAEQAWPELRQGVRVNGWVMLRQVRLGWEIWRQLNGFPVSLAKPEGESGTGDQEESSEPKLPNS
jgi:multidrug resistance efflux pump